MKDRIRPGGLPQIWRKIAVVSLVISVDGIALICSRPQGRDLRKSQKPARNSLSPRKRGKQIFVRVTLALNRAAFFPLSKSL